MPQFDITTYGSQIFWLILSFGALFFALNRVIIPRFRATLLKREACIDLDKTKAQELSDQQEKQQHHRLHRLEQAKAEANDLLNRTVSEMDELEDKRIQQIHHQMDLQLKEFKASLEKEKKNLKKNIENLVQQSVDQLLPKLLGQKNR